MTDLTTAEHRATFVRDDPEPTSDTANAASAPPTHAARYRALVTWTPDDPDLPDRAINAGDIVDADDPLYQRHPERFAPLIEER